VRFVCDKSSTSTTSTQTEAEVLTPAAIAVLPPDLVAQQLQASEKQDAIGLKLALLKFVN
jgi:hypothetical protein